MHPHLRERFYQRYGVELTGEILNQLRTLCVQAHLKGLGRPDPRHYDREHVRVAWGGHEVRVVWHPGRRHLLTFLAPWHRDHTL